MTSPMDRPLSPKRRRWPAVLGTCGLLGVGLSWLASTQRGGLPVIDRQQLRVATVTRQSLVRRVSAPGRLEPVHVRWLTATHRARIEKVLVRSGQRVTADTVVAELRNPETKFALLEAQRGLAAAQIQVASTRRMLDTRRQQLEEKLASAEEQNRLASTSATRGQYLQHEGVLSVAELSEWESRLAELSRKIELLKKQLAGQPRARERELAPGRTLVASLSGMVEHQQQQVRELTLTSGAAGVVHSLQVQPGQWVESGAVLAKLIVSEDLKAVLQVDEVAAKDVAVGQRATIVSGNVKIAGRVSQIDPNASLGSVIVEVLLEERSDDLRPEQRVGGEIEVETYSNALSLPAPVNFTRRGRFRLYQVIDDHRLLAKQVELLPATASRVVVASGLLEGDHVVVSDTHRFEQQNQLLLK